MNLLIIQAKMDTSFPLELEARAEPEHAAEAIVEARIGLPLVEAAGEGAGDERRIPVEQILGRHGLPSNSVTNLTCCWR